MLSAIDALTIDNMATTAAVIVEACIERRESRSSHYRTDRPERDDARFGAGGQRVDHRGGVLTMFGQRPAEDIADGRGVGVGGHGPLVDCGEKCLGVCCGSAEAGGAVRHDPTLRQDNAAAISSKAAMVGNSLLASWGSGQLDSLAATRLAARLT